MAVVIGRGGTNSGSWMRRHSDLEIVGGGGLDGNLFSQEVTLY